MDFLDELEAMAQIVAHQPDHKDEPDDEDVKKWQRLFGCTAAKVVDEIKCKRSDLHGRS